MARLHNRASSSHPLVKSTRGMNLHRKEKRVVVVVVRVVEVVVVVVVDVVDEVVLLLKSL